jgi:hypothetical protein
MADICLEETDTIAAEVRTAQAVSVVSSLTISLVANCFIALTTVAIL